MKATVVVSCYNHANYLSECLESILSQDIQFDCDILVSDDCSTDASVQIVKEYQLKYPGRIVLIARETNIGHARNYIESHRAATGDIIFEFDGDDVMLPGKLQQQYDVFKNNPDVNLVFHRSQYFSDDGTYSSETGTPIGLSGEILYFDARDLALWGTSAVHSSYAYRKSSRKMIDPGKAFMEWLFAMDSLVPEGKGAYMNQVLIKYRCNPHGHGSYLSTREGRARGYAIYLSNVMDYFDQSESLRFELYANCLFTSLTMFKARCGVAQGAFRFLLRHLRYFRVTHFLKTFKMRRSVAPALKVR